MYLFEDDRDGYSIRPDTPEQRKVYNYVRSLATLPSQEAIDRFYRLLWQGNTYPREDVKAALHQVIAAKDFDQHKLKIMNRCYYTLVNRWHLDGSRDDALAELILRLDSLPADRGQSSVTRTLRDTLRTYKASEYCTILKKNLYLLNGWEDGVPTRPRERYFGDLFPEYFFIYEAGTQTHDIEAAADQLNDGVLQRRNQKLWRYHQELKQFYQRSPRSPEVTNPTQQLTPQELRQAIKYYNPRRPDSIMRQAVSFQDEIKPLRLVGECKRAVYDHIMHPTQHLSPNHQRLFSREFNQVLDEFQDDGMMTRTTEIQMFSRLLNAIARFDNTCQEDARFYRFVTIAGPQVMTSLLLRIILTCRMVRFELEKRFAYLHHKFSQASQESVQWLVEAFDHMNVALALNAKYLNYFTLSSWDSTSLSIPDSC